MKVIIYIMLVITRFCVHILLVTSSFWVVVDHMLMCSIDASNTSILFAMARILLNGCSCIYNTKDQKMITIQITGK